MDYKFAVIGAGSGGQAMAAHLALMGAEVNLYNRSSERIAPLKKRKGIQLHGVIHGFGKPHKITTNIKEAVDNIDVIMVAIPASGHKDIARVCAPYLKDGQIVILNPGRTFGALEFIETIRKEGSRSNITIAEAQTIIYTCRSEESARVDVLALKNKVSVAALPATETSKVIEITKSFYPQFSPETNVLKTSLDNVGAILHPTPTLLNVGWIESPHTQFKYYYEGITPNIANFLEIMDQERINVAEALGVKAISVRDWLYKAYGVKGKSLYEALQENDKYRTIEAPHTIKHRYIYEDVPTGLVPIASLGNMLRVPTPNIKSMISLASKITGVNFWRTGRTVQKLGLKGLTVDEIEELVKRGYQW